MIVGSFNISIQLCIHSAGNDWGSGKEGGGGWLLPIINARKSRVVEVQKMCRYSLYRLDFRKIILSYVADHFLNIHSKDNKQTSLLALEIR